MTESTIFPPLESFESLKCPHTNTQIADRHRNCLTTSLYLYIARQKNYTFVRAFFCVPHHICNLLSRLLPDRQSNEQHTKQWNQPALIFKRTMMNEWIQRWQMTSISTLFSHQLNSIMNWFLCPNFRIRISPCFCCSFDCLIWNENNTKKIINQKFNEDWPNTVQSQSNMPATPTSYRKKQQKKCP